MNRTTLAAAIVFLLALGAAEPARAQSPSSSTISVGAGLGVGSLRAVCDGCDAAFAGVGLQAHVRWNITPRVALFAELWPMYSRALFLVVYQNLAVVGVQVWPLERGWIKAGAGAASAGYSWRGFFIDRADRTETSPGIMTAIGYDVYVDDAFGIEVDLRYGTGFYSRDPVDDFVIRAHSIALEVGIDYGI